MTPEDKVKALELQIDALKAEVRGATDAHREAVASNDRMIRERDDANRLNCALKDILRRVEWSQDGPMKSYCPICESEKGKGHDEGCDLGHALYGAFPPTSDKPKSECERCCKHPGEHLPCCLHSTAIEKRIDPPQNPPPCACDCECHALAAMFDVRCQNPKCQGKVCQK
jgi:hypothetical protein